MLQRSQIMFVKLGKLAALVALASAFPAVAFAAGDIVFTLSPTSDTLGSTTVSIGNNAQSISTAGCSIYAYNPDGSAASSTAVYNINAGAHCGYGPTTGAGTHSVQFATTTGGSGDYTILFIAVGKSTADFSGQDYTTTISTLTGLAGPNTDQYYGTQLFNVPGSSPPSPPLTGISLLIASSDDAFASTTGFTISAVALFAGDDLIKLFMGSGLAVLYNIRYWIAALIIIAAVVYFGFRALRFFNH